MKTFPTQSCVVSSCAASPPILRGQVLRLCANPFAVALCCFLVLIAVTPAVAQSRSQAAASIAAALRSRDYQQALQLSRSALQAFPNDPQLLAMEGLSLSGMGNNHGALTAYDAALKLVPDYLPALEGAAQIEYNAGSERAADLLQRILKIRPDDPTSNAMLGVLAYRHHDCGSAIRHFQLGAEVLSSQPAALEEYGFCLVRTDHAADAVKVYATLVSLSPQNPRATIHLAAAQFIAGQSQQALATLEPLLRQSGADAEAFDIASNAAEEIGNTPRAVRLLREALIRNPQNVNYYLDFATLAFDHSSYDVGIDMLNVGLRHLPKSAPLYLARGILHVQLGQYDQGESDFEAAERLDPRQVFSSESESLAQLQQNPAGDALSTVRSRLKQHPNDPVLLYLLAKTLAQNGAQPGSPEFREALRSAERAIQLNPSLLLGRDLLGKLYFDNGQFAKSIEQCRLALRADPTDQEAIYRLTQALRKSGQRTEIPQLLKRLAGLREEDRKKEADRNRYKLIESVPGKVSLNQ